MRGHTDEFLESEDIHRMDWLARSPDLNPVEHVSDAFGWAIATRNPSSKNHLGNENSVAELGVLIATQKLINCLISSMASHSKACTAVIGAVPPIYLFLLFSRYRCFQPSNSNECYTCVCTAYVEG
ncbi:transposable element Tc1 transposase [Trichonephila clavipes]|nr:transposable element Tc1 transposase [Trichonephila clavipes]